MRYIFENGNSDKYQQKETSISKYAKWMKSILRIDLLIGILSDD